MALEETHNAISQKSSVVFFLPILKVKWFLFQVYFENFSRVINNVKNLDIIGPVFKITVLAFEEGGKYDLFLNVPK